MDLPERPNSPEAQRFVFTWDEELPFHKLPRYEQGKAAFLHNHCMGQLTGNDPQFIQTSRVIPSLTAQTCSEASGRAKICWITSGFIGEV